MNENGKVLITLKINGKNQELQIEPRVSLLDALREFIGLTGTKKGCNQGGCGACTVLVDGETRINSCLALAIQYEGREIKTVEGLANSELHPLQKAFIEHDGFQCGYCTPGQICSAIGMRKEFEENLPSAVSDSMTGDFAFSDEEIRERMSGNLCRCGAYNGIIDAIEKTYSAEVSE